MRLCEGRIAIVTGAGRGVGRAHALMLAGHGAKVIVNDLGATLQGEGNDPTPAAEVVGLIRKNGGEAVANGDDVSNWEGARRLVAHAVDTYGGLDVLVNNAGILRDRFLTNMTEDEWDAVVKVHLKGTFAPMRHAIEHWRARQKLTGEPVNARIINTTSISGLFGNPSQANYGAAKAGVAALTIIAARELGRLGVTCNAISPFAMTRMTEGLGQITPEQRRLGDPANNSPVVAWLASTDSQDITGRIFRIGSGFVSVMEGWENGPRFDPIDDPAALGAVIRTHIAKARKNTGPKGTPLD